MMGADPAPQGVDALWPGDGAHEQALVDHRQIAPLDQRQAEIAREMRLFRIALVIGPGGEQGDARFVAVAIGRDAAPQVAIEPGMAAGVDFRQQRAGAARQGQPVFQRIADAGGQAGAIGQHAPLPIGPARQIGGIDM